MQDHPGRNPAHDNLWFVLDPEELLTGAFRTKREALRYSLGPHRDGHGGRIGGGFHIDKF